MSDHYNLLGVSPQASGDEIRKAFRREAKYWHPDALAGRPAAEREAGRVRFILLAQAYQVLSDPQRRRAYDRGRQAAGMPRNDSVAAEGMHPSATRHGPRPSSGGSRTRQPGRPARDAGRGGDTPRGGPRGSAGADSGTARGPARGTGGTARGPARGTGGTLRSAAQGAPSAFRAQRENPDQDLRDVLKEAEQSLARFGLDLRHPVGAALDELLDRARSLYRDLAGSAPRARPDAGAGAPRADPASRSRAEAHAWAEPRPTAGPSARQQARSGGAIHNRAEGEMARFERLSVERELEQMKRAVRNAEAHRVPTVDEELAELRRRHCRKPS
ncbi:MAG: DnaJ domain-containing protein [SAR324 cluster bacterium]